MRSLLRVVVPILLTFFYLSTPAFGAYAQYAATSRTSSGAPLGNYTVTVYVVLSNALATTYSDNAGTVKPNPFLTDINGAYSFWVNGDGLYFIGVTPTQNYAGGYYDARYFSVSGTTVTPLLVPGYRGGVGTSWYYGAGAPSSALGVDADFYLDTGTGNIYAKQGGSWGSPIMTLSGGGGGGGGFGTVTSVAVALDASLPWLSLSGTNPITNFGTITLASATGQTSHRVIGTCGSSTTFGICQEGVADISGLAASATTDTTNATNITSGTLADARLSAYSGVGVCGTNLWVSTLGRDVGPSCTQPGFSNLSGNPTSAQLGSGTSSSATFLRGDLTWQGIGGFPTFNQSTTGNAATATALASAPSNCSAGSGATGINASGAAQGCLPYVQVAGDVGNTAASPQITGTHLASPLPVAQGGSGVTTHTAHGVVVGEGAAAVATTAAGTSGFVLTSNGASSDPTFQSAAGGGGTPGGSTGQIQYNNAGAFGGSGATCNSSGTITIPANQTLQLPGFPGGLLWDSTTMIYGGSEKIVLLNGSFNGVQIKASNGNAGSVTLSGTGFFAWSGIGNDAVQTPTLWLSQPINGVMSFDAAAVGDGKASTVSLFAAATLGASVASATSITPTARLFHVTGIAPIATITAPWSGFTGCISIIPDGLSSLMTGGNIALASTLVISKVNTLCFDGSQWYPSY